MTALWFSIGVLFLLLTATIAMLFALARQVGVLFERINPVGAMISDSGPDIGDTVPLMHLENLNGVETVIGAAGAKAQLIFFLSPTCPICKALLPQATACSNQVGERPGYRMGLFNSVNWCMANEDKGYHCTVSLVVGIAD